MAAVYDYLEEKHGSLPANEQSLRNYIHYLIQTDRLKLEERLRTYTQVPEYYNYSDRNFLENSDIFYYH
jgi:hypothetical protein